MEGQTATNPQTGEKIVFRGGQWQPVGGAPAPRQGPISSGSKPVDPYKASGDARDEARLQILINQEEARAAKEAKEAADKADEGTRQKAAMLSRFKDDARNIARLGKDANDNGGFGETGTSGYLSRSVLPSGTAGYSLDADIQTFKAKNAFAGLTALADQGIKLTPISNEEIKLAAASIANLDPNADHETFMRAVDQTKQYYYDAIARIDPLEAYQTALENGEESDAIIAIAQRNGGPMPDPEFLKKAVDYTKQGGKPNPNTFQPPETPPEGGGPSIAQSLYAGVGDVAEGIGNVAGIIGNPLNAGINAIAGTNLSTDLGQTFRDATGAPQGNALASAINQGGVGAMTGAGLATSAARVGGGYVANALASQPVQQVVGGMTAGAAAEGARQSGASAPVQLGAGLLGGVLGFGGANALMSAARPSTVAPVAQAAARQGVDLLPAQTGGTATRIATAGGRQGIISEIPIAKAVERQAGQLENVRGRASSSVGNALDKEDAGDLVRKAANIYSKKTGETGGALYTRAYNRAGNTKASLPEAVKIAETEMAKIAQAPGGKDTALYKELAALKKSMEGGKFSIEGIRSMRTTLREEADFKGIRGTNSTRIYGEIINAASDDMAKALKAAGKEDAASAFKTADDFWKSRVETIDEVLDPVLGKNTARSGEQIVSALERMANRETGDASKLRRLMNAMPENEARNVRATVIERLGKPSAGQETDSAFSLAKFLTDYNNMSGKAKSILFTGESRKALDDLAEIARADKNAGKLLNSSNTARAVGVQAGVSGLAAWFINPIAAAAIGGGQFAFGKLLASPKFANWMAKVPANPQAQAAHVKRLDAIAAAEPTIANDIASIKQAVQQYLNGAPGLSQAAASDQVGEERPIQP